MGQLEKYGLYVLCLLIFLIFGVTLWGAPEIKAGQKDGAGKIENAKLESRGGGANPTPVGTATNSMRDLVAPELPPKAEPGKSDPKSQAEPKSQPGPQKQGAEPKQGAEQAQPKDAPSPGPEPVIQKRETHRIASGDTFTSIAIQYFGDQAVASEIARLNPKLDPRKLRQKTEVLLPTKDEAQAVLARQKPAAKGAAKAEPLALAGDSYVVQHGDTIEGISIRVFGTRNRVDDIKQLNPGVTPTSMKIGSTLKLPKK